MDVREARDYESLDYVPGAVNVPTELFRDPTSVAEGTLPDPDAFAEHLGAAQTKLLAAILDG